MLVATGNGDDAAEVWNRLRTRIGAEVGTLSELAKAVIAHDQTMLLFASARTNSLPAEISIISVENPVTLIGFG